MNIPIHQFHEHIDDLNTKYKQKPVAVFCAAGVRSGGAKAMLDACGFEKVCNSINPEVTNWLVNQFDE